MLGQTKSANWRIFLVCKKVYCVYKKTVYNHSAIHTVNGENNVQKRKNQRFTLLGKRTYSAADVQTAADEILTEYGKSAKMPGFRPGHIPLSILRQKYNASAISEAIDKLMNKDLNDYIADKKFVWPVHQKPT